MKKTILGTSLLCLCVAFSACSGDDESDGGGGAGGSAGKSGSAGKGGSAGKSGGGGTAGKGGGGGTAGESGSGAGGSAGAEENGGAAGDATGGGGIDAVGGEAGAGGTGDAGAGAGGQPGVTIELRGRWTGEYGPEIIDNDIWASAELIEFSNDENVAITRNPDDAEFDPSKFNRIVWTEVDRASFYYCTTDFGLDSLVAARAGEGRADDADPEAGGCGEGDFTWTKLTSNDIDIFGTYTSSLGTEKIDSLTWTVTSSSGTSISKVIEFSNADTEVITQNGADAADPSKFNRIVWTIADGSYFYCTTDAGLDTLAEAQAADTAADATDPATGGCGDSPWTRLTISL